MTQLKILRGFSLGGGVDVNPGDEIDADKISQAHLKTYIRLGKVKVIEDNGKDAPDGKKGGRK